MNPCQETELYIGLTDVVLSIAITLAKKIKKQCVSQVAPKSLVALKHLQQVLNDTLGSKTMSSGDSIGAPKFSSTAKGFKRRLNFSNSEGTFFIFPESDGSISVRAVPGGRTFVLPKNNTINNVQDAVNFIYGGDTSASANYSSTYDSSADGFFDLSSYESSGAADGSSFTPHVASTPNQSGAYGSGYTPYVSGTPNQSGADGSGFAPYVTSTPNQTGLIQVDQNPDKTYSLQRKGASGRARTFLVPHNAEINSPVRAATFVFGGKSPDSGFGRTYNANSGGSAAAKRTFVKQMPDGTFVVTPN